MPIGIGLPVESKYIARRPQENHFGPTHWKAVVSRRPSSGQLTASRRELDSARHGGDEENHCSPEAGLSRRRPRNTSANGATKANHAFVGVGDEPPLLP
jgi:hypothetical protein